MPLLYAAVSFAQTANFTADATSGCSPLVVNFQNQSTGNITSYFWDFGNGATSTLRDPSTTYFTSGTYTVKLTITNAQGSKTMTRNQYITVYVKPSVNFKVNDSVACFPHRAQFTDLSTASSGTTNSTWLWDFGDGTQGSVQNPLHIYTNTGNYNVTLKVTNDKGCFAVFTKQAYIKIAGGVQNGFTNTRPVVCKPPFNISFTNTASGPGTLSWIWDFGDGNTSTAPNPTHTYNSAGTYTVSLATTSSDGCSDTLTKVNVLSIPNIQTSFSAPDSICINSPVQFQNTSSPGATVTDWHFGDGTTSLNGNPVKIYNTVNTYTVSLYTTYSFCKDSFFKNIKTLPRPVAAFTANNTSKCQPSLSVNFTDASSNAVSWLWDFGDGGTSGQQNPTHNYTAYGTYNVRLIVTNASGCTDTLTKPNFIKIIRPTITILPLPARACIPYTLTPTPVITTLDAVTSYAWNFGDGNTSTLSNPTNLYATQGTYNVSLTITTSTGCTETLNLPGAVKVGRRPVINFSATPNPVCAFQPVQFTDLTNEADEWFWIFGDGGTSGFQNPMHEYGDTGVFSVMLHAINNGCEDSLLKTDFIRVKPPISKFGYQTTCLNRLQFSFKDSSIGATSWFWDFGDGNTSNLQNPVHQFPAYGIFNVSLTVSNDTCSHTLTKPVRVINETPDFIGDQNKCRNGTFYFNILASVNAQNIVSYEWDFSDGPPENGSSYYQHYYTNSGDYTVTLITTDLYGCKDTLSKPNYVHVKGPTSGFNASNVQGCKGLVTDFTDLSQSDGFSNIINWKWDFGDGTIQNFSSGGPRQHTYLNPGTFSVSLVVTDAGGCKDSLMKPSLVITSNPKALFTANDSLACPGSTVLFSNTSNAVNYTSVWNFGDGNTSTLNNPSNIFTTNGTYTVKLIVTDQYGCRDSLIRPGYIIVDKPIASFTVNDSISSCTPFEVQFTNTSQYSYAQKWDLGGGVSFLFNPVMFYNTPGIYPIKLLVVSHGQCFDSTYGTIRVYDTVGSKVNYVPLDGCKPLNVALTAYSPGPMKYTWDFGDGVLITNDSLVMNHVYNFFGNFVPKVIMTDPAGCIIPVTGPDTIRIKGATVKFGLDNRFYCDSGRVNFTDSTIYNDSLSVYNWDFGDGGISHLQNPSHYYSTPGNYSVLLNVQTQNACVDTFRLNNVIRIVESPLISVGGDSVICVNDFMDHLGVFQRTDTSAVQWSWKFPNGGNSAVQNPVPQKYTTPGNFVVTAIATNSSGCKDTTTRNIRVNPLPTVSMPSTLTMQAGFPVQIPATYTSNVISYNWVPSATLDCDNCPQPTASPKFNTNYTVSFVDSNGCTNTGIIQVIVICKNANVFVPNTFSPNGDGANDVFYIRGKGLDRVKSLRIFNRWGEVVFEQSNFPVNNPSYGWDGKFRGNKPVPDVYIYQVEVFCDNSQIIHFEGNVALIQ